MAIDSSRAPRRTDEYFSIMTQTGPDLAPGSYHSDSMSSLRGGGSQASYPFNSLQERSLNPNTATSGVTPGPGSYINQALTSKHLAEPSFGEASTMSGTGLRSKSARIAPVIPGSTVYSTSTILENPGPGAYEAGSEWSRALPKEPLCGLRPVAEAASRERTAPSIPPGRLLPGQRPIDDAPDISRSLSRYRGDRSDMAGPGEYDLPTAFDRVSRLGPHIGGGAAKARQLWEPSSEIGNRLAERGGPGPGHYDVRILPNDKAHLAGLDSNFASKSAMAHQREAGAPVPGPGQYVVTGDIDRAVKQARDRGVQLDGRFTSTTPRVGWNRDVNQPYKDPFNALFVPGPGHYGDPAKSAIASPNKKAEDQEKLTNGGKKKLHGIHHPAVLISQTEQRGPLHAFLTTDGRPCMKPGLQTTPAPAQYDIELARGLSMDSTMRERQKVGRRGVFGTCEQRFHGGPMDASKETANVAWSAPSSTVEEAQDTSALQSKVKRFEPTAGPREPNKALGHTETPAPGTYNTLGEPNYRSPFRTPRQDHVSFGSSDKRFTGAAANFGKTPTQGADPGQYDPKFDSVQTRVKGGGRHNSSRRPPMIGCTTESVGPGSYGDPIDSKSLAKKSHNVSRQDSRMPNGSMSARAPVTTGRRTGRAL